MGSWVLVITCSGHHLLWSSPALVITSRHQLSSSARHNVVIMRLRWTTLLSPLLALAGTSSSSSQTSWSNLGLLSSQASKRSVEDSHESFLADDMVTSASDNLSETDNSYDLADFKSPESRVEPHRRRKKYRTRRRKNRYEPPLVVPSPDNQLADNVLYERDSGYSPPSSSYEAPSYNSYEAPAYESPSYSPSYEAYGGGKDGFNDFLNALAAFLPIGLFLAAIPPNLIVINSRRRRDTGGEFEADVNSVETVFPFLEEISQLGGMKRLNEIECQKKLFCEMAARGLSEQGNFVQNTLGSVVSHTPAFLANMAGLEDLFQVAKAGDCAEFQCTSY